MVETLVYLVIYIIVLGIVLGLLLWIVDQVPMFAPFAQVARVLIMVIGALILIFLLLSLVGVGPPLRRLG